MNVIKLIVVSPAGWTNRQEHVPDYLREEKGEARIAGRLADCLATTTGMPREPMNYQRFQFSDTTGSYYHNDHDAYLRSSTRYEVLSAKWPNYGFRVVAFGSEKVRPAAKSPAPAAKPAPARRPTTSRSKATTF